jgi:SAM-dependent methyltransferase
MARVRRILCSVVLIVSIGQFLITGCYKGKAPDVRYVPTPDEVVIEMFRMARVTQNDTIYDLGCGDGRIVITAAKIFGARGVGVDIDPFRIQESQENARKAGVTDRVRFIQQDLFQTDIGEATVVALYLSANLNLKLRPKLFQELKPGTRILSHEFAVGDWKPDYSGRIGRVKIYYNPQNPQETDTNYFFWVIPANVAGSWRWRMSTSTGDHEYTLRLDQTFQEIRGKVSMQGREVPIAEPRLAGDQLNFTFNEDMNEQKALMRFNGRISGDTIRGNVVVQGGPSAGSYSWTAKREF